VDGLRRREMVEGHGFESHGERCGAGIVDLGLGVLLATVGACFVCLLVMLENYNRGEATMAGTVAISTCVDFTLYCMARQPSRKVYYN
jgi:hypothetical protein